jgi:hypothetical protein
VFDDAWAVRYRRTSIMCPVLTFKINDMNVGERPNDRFGCPEPWTAGFLYPATGRRHRRVVPDRAGRGKFGSSPFVALFAVKKRDQFVELAAPEAFAAHRSIRRLPRPCRNLWKFPLITPCRLIHAFEPRQVWTRYRCIHRARVRTALLLLATFEMSGLQTQFWRVARRSPGRSSVDDLCR